MKRFILKWLGIDDLSVHRPLTNAEVEYIIAKDVKKALKIAFSDDVNQLVFSPHDYSSLCGSVKKIFT